MKDSNHKFGTNHNPKIVPRIELFSDAVFAIAITLLIINCIEARHHTKIHKEPLFDALYHLWPIFMGYAMGFFSILICWINHYFIFKHIKTFNSALLWFNGFVLFTVTFIPFPTAIVSDHIASDAHSALLLCGGMYFLMAFAYYMLWQCARKGKLINPTISKLKIRSLTFVYRFGIAYTSFALVVSWYSLSLGITLYVLLFLIFGFPKKLSDLIIKLKLIKPNSRK